MLLRLSLGLAREATAVEAAVSIVLEGGLRTRDIAAAGEATIGTRAFGEAIVAALA